MVNAGHNAKRTRATSNMPIFPVVIGFLDQRN